MLTMASVLYCIHRNGGYRSAALAVALVAVVLSAAAAQDAGGWQVRLAQASSLPLAALHSVL